MRKILFIISILWILGCGNNTTDSKSQKNTGDPSTATSLVSQPIAIASLPEVCSFLTEERIIEAFKLSEQVTFTQKPTGSGTPHGCGASFMDGDKQGQISILITGFDDRRDYDTFIEGAKFGDQKNVVKGLGEYALWQSTENHIANILSVYRNQLVITIGFDSWNLISIDNKKNVAIEIMEQLNEEILKPKIKT
ncbi:hypothetical protein ACJD0Z_01135 [Flavobacteriaceae bacterium M23B6Z8]